MCDSMKFIKIILGIIKTILGIMIVVFAIMFVPLWLITLVILLGIYFNLKK